MIQEYDTVVLVRDFPALGLKQGDVGAVIHIYGDEVAVEVEFVSGAGTTVGVETLALEDVRPLARDEILHVRVIAA